MECETELIVTYSALMVRGSGSLWLKLRLSSMTLSEKSYSILILTDQWFEHGL